MKIRLRIFFFFILLILFVGCNQAGAGPITWIDFPSQDITLPLAPFSILAHASDNDSIESIEFHINGELKKSLEPNFDGSDRLGWAEWEFSPQMTGVYRIEVKANDGLGNAGSVDTTIVTIAVMDLPEAPATPIEIPGSGIQVEVPAEEVEEELLADRDDSPIAIANRNANCRVGPGTEYEIVGVLLLNETSDVIGRLSDNSWFFIALPVSSRNCWISAITVKTQGKMDQVSIISAPPPPPLSPVEEESPPADTEPPGIFGSGTSKTSMCASDKINSNVLAYDAGGIKKIYANWRIINSSGSEVQSGYVEYVSIPSEDYGYTAVLGNFSYSGTLKIKGTVEDNAGNKAYFTNTVTIDCS